MISDDPLELKIAAALDARGLPYEHERSGLDFHLVGLGVDIEVKRFHAPRVVDQMARSENIIVAQGEKAVSLLAMLIAGE